MAQTELTPPHAHTAAWLSPLLATSLALINETRGLKWNTVRTKEAQTSMALWVFLALRVFSMHFPYIYIYTHVFSPYLHRAVTHSSTQPVGAAGAPPAPHSSPQRRSPRPPSQLTCPSRLPAARPRPGSAPPSARPSGSAAHAHGGSMATPAKRRARQRPAAPERDSESDSDSEPESGDSESEEDEQVDEVSRTGRSVWLSGEISLLRRGWGCL